MKKVMEEKKEQKQTEQESKSIIQMINDYYHGRG
jgi:hypothetical protein